MLYGFYNFYLKFVILSRPPGRMKNLTQSLVLDIRRLI